MKINRRKLCAEAVKSVKNDNHFFSCSALELAFVRLYQIETSRGDPFYVRHEDCEKILREYKACFCPVSMKDRIAWVHFNIPHHEKLKIRIRMLNAFGSGHPERIRAVSSDLEKLTKTYR